MDSFVQIIAKAKQNDPVAVQFLLDRYAPVIRGECAAIGLNRRGELSCSDLVQETTVRLVTRLHLFDGNPDEQICQAMFGKWLRVLTRNVAINLVNGKKLHSGIPDEMLDELVDDSITPSQKASASEEQDRIRQAIGQLDEESQTLIRLCFSEGCSLRAAAEQMEISYDQARTRFSHALLALRKKMTEE